MRKPSPLLPAFVSALVVAACPPPSPAEQPDSRFAAYWHQGKAEITSYSLEQARYGEVHPGHAVLIYVTEDFSRSKQVKLDRPLAAGADRVPILKLNFTKNFNTGIYPYSMMTSVFSPVDSAADRHALKITTSSQEWCGHTFTQLNRVDDGYLIRQLSYFESEGDESLTVEDAVTEDELWTAVRLDPSSLPTGRVRLIPGTMFSRLRHLPWEVQEATASLGPVVGKSELSAYELDYPALGRTLTIHFSRDFPYTVEGWEESYTSGWGAGASRLTTRATRMRRLLSDYWARHDLADATLRRELGLD